MHRSLFSPLVLAGAAWSAVLQPRALSCQENVAIPVTVTAENLVLPSTFNISALTTSEFDNLTSTLPTASVTGTYTITGRYCKPAKSVAGRNNTLQLLVHGITYTRNYWSGLGPPGNQYNGSYYSWIDYASQQGYPTFSVDRICNGQSSKPNGLLVCQVPLNAQTLHGVIEAARAGQIGGHAFSKVIYVGHSEGSLIGNKLAQLYPKDVDTYVETGFSRYLVIGAFGTIVAAGFAPAAVVDPAMFAADTDLTYLAASIEAKTTGVFYAGQFSQAVSTYDYAHRGTVTTGEFATALLGQLPATGFVGSILVLSGERDQIFCARLPTDPLIGYLGNCGEGATSYTSMTRSLYPNAAVFEYNNVADTGHDLNLHYTAQQTFKIAHDFLASEGY